MFHGDLDSEEIQSCWRQIQQACGPRSPSCLAQESGRSNDAGDADVFLVKKQGVSVVAFVLSKSFAMIPEKDEQSIRLQPTRPQAVQEFTQRSVGVMQRIPILPRLLIARKGSLL